MKRDENVAVQISTGVVKPEWIDINGHMNVAYYIVAFDLAVDSLWESCGMGQEYIEGGRGSTFAVESHVLYKRELKEAAPYRITAEILAYDEKRVHQFQRMYHAEENFLAATAEWMNLHVDLESRRVSNWPESVLQAIGEVTRAQGDRTMPVEAGKRMHIGKPLYAMRRKQ